MRSYAIVRKTLLVIPFLFAQVKAQVTPAIAVQTFPLKEVHLLPGIFKEAETTDLHYMMALNPDRLLAPYLREAGLTPKAQSYTNWENSGLDGHTGGHYLSALSLLYAETGNKKVKERLDYMIAELKKCQEANGNGYIGGVPGSKALWIAVMGGNVAAITKKWVPLYNIHKTYAGIRDAWLIGQNVQAKKMFFQFSDWFVRLADTLSAVQMQEMLKTEHGGINEVLADAYQLSGNKKYLDAAYAFSHKAILEPLAKGQDQLNNLHANTQIPKVIGFERIGELAHDSTYANAARFFWQTVVTHRTIAIGGNSVYEHFNPLNDFSSMINSEQGPETCNTYNMLKLTRLLYQDNPEVKYIDFYERALYNHILSTQHPGTGGFVYFTSIRPGHYRVYSQPQTSMWCCVGTGMENQAKYNEMIYAHDKDNLYINLFIASRLQWKEKGLVLTQQTNFPEEDKTLLTIDAAGKGTTTLHIRYPSWVAKNAVKVWINGQVVAVKANPSEWIIVNRIWKKGDKIEVQLPMHITTESLPDGLNFVAVLHGPIVLAAKTTADNMPGLYANDSRMGHAAYGKKYTLYQAPMFVSNDNNIIPYIESVAGKPLTFCAVRLIRPAKYDSLELIPFYKVHDTRYVIYWQKETPQSLQAIKEKLMQEEMAAARLDSLTTDVVRAGEQQPESDHFIESDQSFTGVNNDRHWRSAKGWFSYQLKAPKTGTASVNVTYYGKDKDRQFSLLANGQVIANIMLDGGHGNDFFTEEYPIPAAILATANGMLTVKMVAQPGSITAGIYEIRIINR